MEVLIFIALVLGMALAVAVVLLLRYMEDADRYRWLRDYPASLVANNEISRWLLRRPFGAEKMDAVIDVGMGRAQSAAAHKGE